MPSLHVALLANLKKNAPSVPGIPADFWADLDSENTVDAIADALRQGGHRVTFLEGDVTLFDRLREVQPDICFNICEGHFGDSREAHVPAVLEMMRMPVYRLRRADAGAHVGQADDQAGAGIP